MASAAGVLAGPISDRAKVYVPLLASVHEATPSDIDRRSTDDRKVRRENLGRSLNLLRDLAEHDPSLNMHRLIVTTLLALEHRAEALVAIWCGKCSMGCGRVVVANVAPQVTLMSRLVVETVALVVVGTGCGSKVVPHVTLMSTLVLAK